MNLPDLYELFKMPHEVIDQLSRDELDFDEPAEADPDELE